MSGVSDVSTSVFEAVFGSVNEEPGATTGVDTATCGVTNRTVTLCTTDTSVPPLIGR